MTQQPQAEMWSVPCYYCGVTAQGTDHVVPQSVIQAARNSGDEALIAAVENRRRQMTVRSCVECNSIAGGVYDETLEVRKKRIKARLRVRHAALLTIPDWNNHELMDLAPRLRNRVIYRIEQRDLLRRRLAW